MPQDGIPGESQSLIAQRLPKVAARLVRFRTGFEQAVGLSAFFYAASSQASRAPGAWARLSLEQ